LSVLCNPLISQNKTPSKEVSEMIRIATNLMKMGKFENL
jgi:hypothetical protein